MNFFRISDPGSKRYVFLVRFSEESLFFNFLLIKLAPETIKSKKKVGFIFHPYFYVCRIRDPVLFRLPDPG
jgi:hypothetical protein